jgi:hypothetical protein
LVQGWARDGLSDEQIATNLGIHVSTLYRWDTRHSEFREARKKGKEWVDREVENALLKSAMGYAYTEEVVTNKGDVVTVERQQAPSVTAQIFWLKNRKPDQFSDHHVQEHRTPPGRPLEMEHTVHGVFDAEYLGAVADLLRAGVEEPADPHGAGEPVDSGEADR